MKIIGLFFFFCVLFFCLHQAGNEIVWANDIDADAVKAGSKN